MTTLDGPPLLPGPDRAGINPRSQRARELAALARARIANIWLRLATCALVSFVAASAVGDARPFFWLAGLIPVLYVERVAFQRLVKECAAGEPPKRLLLQASAIVLQAVYTGSLGVLLWFAKYAHGETLAVILMVASLANVAATLRSSALLALCSALPIMALMLGLPFVDYALGGFRTSFDLIPLVGSLLFIGFGFNLWRGLRESDAAQARAEQAAMRERQSAAAAAAAKSDTIKRMQDELRTPMTALISAAEHLRRAAASPEARTHIAALAQAGEVLRLVLEDLSELDHLENGKVRIDPKPCDPAEIARTVMHAFRAAADDKRLELFLDIAPNVPSSVELDAARVRQILFNLVANAVKYTSHGGVRLRVQAQAGEAGRVRLGFSVADTGIGMSRSQLALIFGNGRVRGGGEGPGLGLGISMRLARLMGGKLGGKSEIGQGSVLSFVIEAPLVHEVRPRAAIGA